MESTERLSNLLATALGSDVIELLKDELVSEIRLNADGSLWAHRLGEGKRRCDTVVTPINAHGIHFPTQLLTTTENSICQLIQIAVEHLY